MRIALVSDWFLPRLGGIELQMRDLALRLRERGHEVEVITPVPGPDRVDGIPVHRLDVPRLPGAGIVYTAAAFRRLRELLDRGRYDVVHVHFGIIAPAAYGATRIAQSFGFPTVATFHSVLSRFEVPLWLVRGAMGASQWRVKWSAVSTVVAESIRPLVGSAEVSVVPNAVDTRWWSSGRRPAADGRPIRIISVMRLHPRKRPRALIEAFAQVARSMPADRRPELRIVGDGVARAAVRRLIERKGLDDVVTLCGWLPQEAVRDELHRADLFVLPSRLEAFGIAALEARCAGLPVIAMAESGARDFLTDGTDSLLAGSDEELAAHLRRLVVDAALRRRLTEACEATPCDGGWDAAIVRQEILYHEAVSLACSRPGS